MEKRVIEEARGRHDHAPETRERRMLERWAAMNNLTVAHYL